MEHYQSIVIGAGPTGSYYALWCAMHGLRVLLIDKAFFPRPKVCGHILNPGCSEFWHSAGITDSFEKLPHHIIEGLNISAEGGPSISVPYGRAGSHSRAVARDHLDEWLRQMARKAGADCLTGVTPTEILEDGTVITTDGEFSADVVVGADGRSSWVAQASDFPRAQARCNRMAWQTTIPAEMVDDYMNLIFFPEGYLGAVRFNDTAANLYMVVTKGSVTPQKLSKRFFPDLKSQSWHSTFPITRNDIAPAKDKIILLGDAARVLPPFVGEGLYMGLASAQLAAFLTVENHQAGTMNLLQSEYASAHSKLYAKRPFGGLFANYLESATGTGYKAIRWAARFPWLIRGTIKRRAPQADLRRMRVTK